MKVALITGGAKGIGAATARRLSAEGYAVGINYLSSAVHAITLATSLPNAIAVKCDIASPYNIISLFDKIESTLGPITALVNNAAVMGARHEFIYDCGNARKILETNIYGTMLCSQEALKRMKPGSSIVNLSSQAAISGGHQMAAYAASKAAINSFTVSLARESAPLGVRVNAVSPGIIGEAPAKRIASCPMARAGTPEEVAEVIAWLLSDKASYVSGAILPISGAR